MTDDPSLCLTCVAWIGRMGASVRVVIADVADDCGCTPADARARLLAAYHHYHEEQT